MIDAVESRELYSPLVGQLIALVLYIASGATALITWGFLADSRVIFAGLSFLIAVLLFSGGEMAEELAASPEGDHAK